MVNSKIIKRLLAGVLCTSLIFQSVSIGVDAREEKRENNTESIIFEKDTGVIDFDEILSEEDKTDEERTTVDDKEVSEAVSISEEENFTSEEEKVTECETESSITEEHPEEEISDVDDAETDTETETNTETETESQLSVEENVTDNIVELYADNGSDESETEEFYSVFVEAYKQYDNMGEYLHLKVTGDVNSIKFADEGFKYNAKDDYNNLL
ncbi:MAG: hypothetical protein U0L56_06475, partial [Lachnospiraceae bacterium]|nr:hypothetical protein [Lachnospiraceae bacterium]